MSDETKRLISFLDQIAVIDGGIDKTVRKDLEVLDNGEGLQKELAAKLSDAYEVILEDRDNYAAICAKIPGYICGTNIDRARLEALFDATIRDAIFNHCMFMSMDYKTRVIDSVDKYTNDDEFKAKTEAALSLVGKKLNMPSEHAAGVSKVLVALGDNNRLGNMLNAIPADVFETLNKNPQALMTEAGIKNLMSTLSGNSSFRSEAEKIANELRAKDGASPQSFPSNRKMRRAAAKLAKKAQK